MRSIHTDLACELSKGASIRGIETEQYTQGQTQITKITVQTPAAAQRIGKPMGHYYTLMHPSLCEKEPELVSDISLLIGQILRELMPPQKKERTVLILGLGNSAITPDALGSKTTQRVLVTRHAIENMPDAIDERLNSVCAIAPGVLGVTGLETGEVAQGIVQHIHPSCVICIDSLAAMSLKRVLTTVQIADTGICPGSGLNNPRRELTEHTLGIPVISVGIPLVVGVQSILNDANAPVPQDDDIWQSMVVTPKDIDEAVTNAACVLGMGINLALQSPLTQEEIASMML